MLADDRTDTVELIDVHRFHQPWEKLVSFDPVSIEFTPYFWHTLVDHADITTDGTITFTFRDGAK